MCIYIGSYGWGQTSICHVNSVVPYRSATCESKSSFNCQRTMCSHELIRDSSNTFHIILLLDVIVNKKFGCHDQIRTDTTDVLSVSPPASWATWHQFWCIWRDSNSHAFRHSHLKAACIPIPPQMHRRDPTVCKVGSLLAQLTGFEPAISWFVAMSSHPIELQLHSFAEL